MKRDYKTNLMWTPELVERVQALVGAGGAGEADRAVDRAGGDQELDHRQGAPGGVDAAQQVADVAQEAEAAHHASRGKDQRAAASAFGGRLRLSLRRNPLRRLQPPLEPRPGLFQR